MYRITNLIFENIETCNNIAKILNKIYFLCLFNYLEKNIVDIKLNFLF